MRMIDGDALRDDVSTWGCNDYDKYDFIEAIDNAQTIEPPKQLVLRARDDSELEQLKEAWGNGTVNFTPIVAYSGRPQGVWKLLYKGDKDHCANYECSLCQREIYFDAKCDSLKDYPYCHCGAEMKGEEE